MNTDIELLPRADLPVIWDAFKAQVEEFRQTAETLIVTDVSQKDKMELACRTRLTLRKIRIAVEHKRVELGEGHLKEIQKVNGAAKAIREFIEPLEARLLEQEGFAERAEEKRIAELTRCRNNEVNSIRPGVVISNIGRIAQAEYDLYIVRLRAEKAELEEANRLRVEAENRLAERQAEAQRNEQAIRAEAQAEVERQRKENAALLKAQQDAADAEVERQRKENAALLKAQQDAADAEVDRKQAEINAAKAEAQRVAEVNKAALELAQRVALDVKQRSDAEAERVRDEQDAKHRAEISAAIAQRSLERAAAEQRRQADLQIEREKTAKLEAELAQERAAKQAEADAARKLALAPDVEKLQGYVHALLCVPIPSMEDPQAKSILQHVIDHVSEVPVLIEFFVHKNLTAK